MRLVLPSLRPNKDAISTLVMDSLGPGISLKGLAPFSSPLTVAVKDKGLTKGLLRGSRAGPLQNIIFVCAGRELHLFIRLLYATMADVLV